MFPCLPWSLKRHSVYHRTKIRSIVVKVPYNGLNELVEKRRDLQIIFDDEGELVVGARPPRLQPLRLQPGVGGPIVHPLLAEPPLEAVDEIQDPPRGVQARSRVARSVTEVVDVDVEVDGVGEVVGGGEGAEAAGEGVEAVEGEDLDEEGEVRGAGGRRGAGIGEEAGAVGDRVPGGGEGGGEGGVGVAVEEEDAEGEEEEEHQVVPLRRSGHPVI